MKNLGDVARESGLGRIADDLVDLSLVGIAIRKGRKGEPGIGASKLGGQPDLPAEAVWPRRGAVPLAFLAQVRLADVAQYDRDGLLPKEGILSFFYDTLDQPWGFDPKDIGGSRVVYTPNSSHLQRVEPPSDLASECRFTPFHVSFDWTLTVPPFHSTQFEALRLTDEEVDAYLELEEGRGPLHRLLGHPSQIQGDMALQCQLVSCGLYCGDGTGYEEGKRRGLYPGAADWRLLLQIDSDDGLDWMWGDMGRVYFWIQKDALNGLSFDKAWTVLQCG